MKRNGGLLAGLLVALTFIGVTNLPKDSEGQGAPESRKPTSPPPLTESGSVPKPYLPCAEIAGRLQRFVSETSGASREWKLPASCYKGEQAPAQLRIPEALPHVGFAIATVPNPVSTHLPLLFDRMVETIQQAAQDETYTYDDSWFPWEAPKDYPLLVDQQTADALHKIQQEQPGVMVFRQGLVQETDGPPYEGGLIVFLVGEKPTGGINDDQFNNALAWISRFGRVSGEQPLRILGPTFSGSLPSLRRVLEENLTAGRLEGYKSKPRLYVSSGTVSSGLDYQWFAAWIKQRNDGSYFRTAMENDSLMTNRFCQYLKDQDYELRNVAFLSEDETAFGGVRPDPQLNKETPPPCNGAVRLYYPRDIATLRSAYQQQSILGATKSQPNANAPATTLRGDLSETSSSDHDTVRTYAGQLTPLAQESILLDIANRLHQNRSQFIVLRSTNSLDQIFLSEFLRRSYPEGRVVIDGADLLFTRGAEGRSLRGVMLLSTYPLLTLGQDWTRSLLNGRTRSYRTFGEDTSEGVYIAARELFRNQGRVPIHDYTAPEWARGSKDDAENNRPATWLSVIGHRQFWPLAVLNSNTLSTPTNQTARPMPPPSPERGDQLPFADVDTEPLRLPTTMWLFVFACAVWSGLHLCFCSNGSVYYPPRARTYFAPTPRRQHSALVAFGSLLPAMLAVVIAATSGLFSWLTDTHLYQGQAGIYLAILLLLMLALSAIACVKNFRLTPSGASDSVASAPLKAFHLRVGSAAILCLAVYAASHMVLIGKLTPANRIPAYWRGLNLLSGVSPLLPQLLFIGGAYLWFWCTLRGLAHFGDDRPRLPKVDDLPKLEDGTPLMPMFSQKAGDRVESAARPLTKAYLKRLIVIFGISAAVCSLALQGPWVRTLGERTFGMLIFVSVSLCISVIIADSLAMWSAWSELRQLMVFLDRLRLRRTLRSLKGLAWGSIWGLSGNVLEERYRVISLQFESLRHVTNTMAEWAPDKLSEAVDREAVLRRLTQCQQKGRAFVEWYVKLPLDVENLTDLRDFQEELASTAGLLMKRVLMPAWQKEKESLIFDRSKVEGKTGEGAGSETAISTETLAPHVQAAEEFFVLPYLAFIQNSLGRLRTIALGILWLFVGATFAVSSYPFDPLNVLGGIFLTVFLVAGGVMIVSYSQMSRDATLSHITNTRPGELGVDFWMRLLTFGIGPLIALLTTLFPSMADFVFSWLQPGVQALK